MQDFISPSQTPRTALRAVAVFCLFMVSGPQRTEAIIVERVAAVVDDEIILLSEVNERVRPYLKKIMRIQDSKAQQRALRRLQLQQLEQLIQEKLVIKEATRRKLKVSDAEVNRAINSVMKQNDVTYKELMNALMEQGISPAQYKANLRKQILRLKVLNMAVRSRISVSEDDVKAFYQKQKRRLGVGQRIKVQLIRFQIPAAGAPRTAGLKAAHRQARRAAAALKKNPAKFTALARRLSDHPSAPKGGDLGFVERGDLQPAVEAVVFAAKENPKKILGPIEADDGVYLVRILDRQESEALPFARVKEKLKQQLFQKRLQRQTQSWLQQLRKKAYVDIKL